jgi:tRNA (adenine22-N1)-methyltransferase
MKLSKRLASIINLIDKCCTAADVGTDHAFIPIYLIKNRICKKVIAIDIKEGPLLKAIENINSNGYQQQIETRLGAGLSVLNVDEVKTIIIAGMGGLMICGILEQGDKIAKKVQSLILQPMTHHFELRKWLFQNDYSIIDEDLVMEDEKIYLILKVISEKDQDNIIPYFGHVLFEKRHPLLGKYIMKNINELEKIKFNLMHKNTDNTEKKFEEIGNKIKLFKRLYEETERNNS